MNSDSFLEAGKVLVKYLQMREFVPEKLIEEICNIADDAALHTTLLEYWSSSAEDSKDLPDVNHPVILSRGWDEIIPKEQINHFLPEEKLLINRDIFREKLENLDLTNIDSTREKNLMSKLIHDSIGLSKNDVLLYYNLLKINQISKKTRDDLTLDEKLAENAKFIFNLANDSFLLNVKEDKAEEVIINIIRRNKSNPLSLSLAMGRENDKFFNYLIEFVTLFISRRGDDPKSILRMIGLYMVFAGGKEEELKSLGLNFNEISFISDRIGKVRVVYYALTLFIHTFNLLISAQVFEISTKYLESDQVMGEKLMKLYSPDNRRKLLFTNALNIATRKITPYKSEAAEILNSFKRFNSKRESLVTTDDLFNRDYRG